mmetsp:Transcript_45159/g.107452  ORF Transcript_45159/g.107452 Transcript_45159/m.107452 type:complete len:236 (+) Transcript_45159:75-782(+)|eukprot:CAMPEP_0178413776 /NCGR_PEP_ID=MMETSP0689_2-20121128/22700_1 /TAXON_ID=160604 /ORGANISM="Amphidinium massartii, Strain CS-259" /LENGTH=235 /DNA_ID=CAMNT_0020035055 /DNA_START=77 /DNA_END=784 /DNA_ORIENTATION=+
MAVHRVLCYGDSNTAGFHSAGRGYEPYANTLAVELARLGFDDCKVRHDGLSGLTAETMASQISSPKILDIAGCSHTGLSVHLESEAKPDLVILMVGTNDLLYGQSPEQTMKNVIRLHKMCHSKGVATIALAPPQVLFGGLRQKRNRLASLLKEWSQRQSSNEVIHYADAEDLVPRNPSGLWEPDQFHFSAHGSRELGRRLAEQLAKMWQEGEEPNGKATIARPLWLVLESLLGQN